MNQFTMADKRHPLPPFTAETAKEKVQIAEDAWNTKDAEKASKAYTTDTEWRNRNILKICQRKRLAYK